MKIFNSILALALVSCAADPVSSSEELVVYEDQDIPTYGSFQEAQSAGISVVEPGAELCAGRIGPGQYCYITVNLNVKHRNFNSTQTGPIWLDGINAEQQSVVDRLNSIGWAASVVNDNSYNWYLTIETTNPTFPGLVGQTAYFVQAYVQSEQGGFYGLAYSCISTIYKTTIQNGPAWNALPNSIKIPYVRNIVDHELSHCAGMPHNTVVGSLMSPNAGGYKTVLLDLLPNELSWLDNYNP